MEIDDAREMLAALLPRLRRLGAALTGSLDRGDELVAATLRRVQGDLGQWPAGMRFDSWVFRTLYNVSATPDRRARQGEGVAWRPDDRMILHNARVAVAGLPEMQRFAVALADAEGLRYDEASRTLDIPRADFAVYLAQGRAALAEDLELGLARRPKTDAGWPADEVLVALSDGELAPKRQGEVAARIDESPGLTARVGALVEAGALVEEAFQDILQEDLPAWLEAELAGGAGEELPPEAHFTSETARLTPLPGFTGPRLTLFVAVVAAMLLIGVIAVAQPRAGYVELDALTQSDVFPDALARRQIRDGWQFPGD